MKSIKLKVLFLALSSLAFSATFAQDDTSHKSKSDTSKMPKHDSTSMIKTHSSGNLISNDLIVMNSALTKNEDKVEAKKEEKVA